MTRSEQKIGKNGERLAQAVLNGLGIEMLEKIGTPVLLSPYVDFRTGRTIPGVFRVKFGEKVSGDRRGILPDGTSVLIEVKTIWNGNLVYSELDNHQHNALKRHAGFKGLSLLVYVHQTGVYVMKYPPEGIPGFVPRKSITPERARELHEETLDILKLYRSDLTP